MITKRLIPIDSVEKVKDLISIGATIHWGDWKRLQEIYPSAPTLADLTITDFSYLDDWMIKFGFCVEVEDEIDGS